MGRPAITNFRPKLNVGQLKVRCREALAGLTWTEALVWFLFLATTFQLAFLRPDPVLIPGERAKVFSGVLCALTLGAACFFGPKGAAAKRPPEVIISLILAALMVLSGIFSLTPGSSSARGFVVLASSLGGFWCARLLLGRDSGQKFFLWFSLCLLAGVLLLSLISSLSSENAYVLLDSMPHPLVTRILLLWFAPIALLLGRAHSGKVLAVLLLALSYLVFFLTPLRAAVLIPLIMALLAACCGALRVKYLVALFIPLLVLLVYFFIHLPKEKLGLGKEYEPAYYRVENYPFSWHIALKHPFLGIGLRAPRDSFLKDYETKYPYATREEFAGSVNKIRTSENIFLTFMAEVGFPFLILYLFSLAVLLARLVRLVFAPPGVSVIPPLALLLPLMGALLIFQVLDGLLHPQISWFFHILLGLIPPGPSRASGPVA
jgi:hypothetical protein